MAFTTTASGLQYEDTTLGEGAEAAKGQQVTVHYAWRAGKGSAQGRALQWWLQQLDSATTRAALLDAQRLG